MPKRLSCSQQNYASIDKILREAVDDRVAPGIVAIAATPEGLIYEGAAGSLGLHNTSPISPDSIFWILSMTKAVTAVACMQLVEQGRLQIDQPAAEILPALANPQVLTGFSSEGAPLLRPAKRPVTVRHLLTHTSGYTYSLWSHALSRYEEATGTPIIFSGKNAAFGVPLEFDPGDKWQYGMSIKWVGKLVEAVGGKSLNNYFRDNIFSPLGMQNTGFTINEEQQRRVAIAVQREADGTLLSMPYEPPRQPEFFMGGTGLFSTPYDYMTFLQMLLRGGSYGSARILAPETVALMFANQIGELNVEKMFSPNPARSKDFDLFPTMAHKWGFSFDINEQPGPYGRSAGSAAWAGALNTHYWIDPVRKITAALFTQVWPFYDDRVVALLNQFERNLYQNVDSFR